MDHEAGQYDTVLVLLSVFVSIAASYTTFDLASRMLGAPSKARRGALYLFASAIFGLGVWSMHFIGIFAHPIPLPIEYDIPLLLVSIALPIIATAIGLFLILKPHAGKMTFAIGGLFAGLAILLMHFTGMASMHLSGHIEYKLPFVIASAAIALGISYVALHLAFSLRTYIRGESIHRMKLVSAALLGLSVAGMHFVAMAGTVVIPDDRLRPMPESSLTDDGLAFWIGCAVLLLFAVVLAVLFKDKHKAVRQAQDLELRYMSLFEHSPDMVLCYDPKADKAIHVNPVFQEAIGYSAEEFSAMDWGKDILAGPADYEAVRACYRNVIARRGAGKVDFRVRNRLGREMLLSATMFPVFLPDRTQVYSISRDVTEQARTEEALIRAKELAENTDRIKSEFLATMSHEIRTPLNGIIGINHLLLDDPDATTTQRELLHLQRRSGQDLLHVINDILDYSKIESGSVTLHEAPFNLTACIEECVELFALRAGQKGIRLERRLSRSVPHLLVGDVGRLKQILNNLLSNAVKFTPHGEIRLEAEVADWLTDDRGSNVALLQVRVSDTGVGIKPEQLHLLFLPFSQLDATTERRFEGTGLGLAICRKLLAQMGGKIWAEENCAVGSCFTFQIPLRTLDTGTVGRQHSASG
ncbi:MHYT domain-containing protein [Cohnella sp. REN36]|uniref:MHYT domain-containing protein n=1 Tax=Cohnella sp. REN36 TaxID=2887347 RepID=UPI001D14C1C6|nr:MHYT domain-containing protein [Cohnella sp. REN36]MCC3373216.1 PAS domain S-box protein [Cohnella sp. REN36]